MKKPFKIYYNGSYIIVLNKYTYIIQLDNSTHDNLTSAKCWIDYLTR
jgi:predicted transcriptional regulator